MTKIEQFFRGYLCVEIESASPELCLNRLSSEEIPFWDVEYTDAFHVRFCVFFWDQKRARKAASRAQAVFSVREEHAGIWNSLRLVRRAGLVISVLLSVALTLYLQEFVWFVQLSGNETVSTTEILRALETVGVDFGVRNDTLDSQNIKNHLLNAVEGLQWAAVNTSGGVCQVLVKERELAPELLNRKLPYDIIAAKSGTITAVSVLEGQALCTVGDTVEAGELLVSGINDFAVNVQTVHAQAEIYARTWQTLDACIPRNHIVRGTPVKQSVCRYLQIGRRRIKISGNSSICGVGCDKISSRYTLTLPGGYELPLTWITETYTEYETARAELTQKEAEQILLLGGERTARASMTAGRILSVAHETKKSSAVFSVQAVYACEEMIAAEREVNLFGSEQIYGRTNSERGTD